MIGFSRFPLGLLFSFPFLFFFSLLLSYFFIIIIFFFFLVLEERNFFNLLFVLTTYIFLHFKNTLILGFKILNPQTFDLKKIKIPKTESKNRFLFQKLREAW